VTKIGADLLRDQLGALGLDLRQADEVHLGMSRRDLGRGTGRRDRPDDREAVRLGFFFTPPARTISRGPMPTDTASLRSAERSAAM